AEVPDAEELSLHLAEPDTEREAARARALEDRAAVDVLRHEHAGQAVRTRGRVRAIDLETPRAHRRAHHGRETSTAGEHLGQPLLEEHVQRLAQAEEDERGRGIRKEARFVLADDRAPVEEASWAPAA